MSKPTEKERQLINKWYSKGHACGLSDGRVQGYNAAKEETKHEVAAHQEALKASKAEAAIKLATAASQALSAIAGILDNSHGVLS